MKKLFAALAAAAALAMGGASHADVLSFTEPTTPLVFDSAGNAVYTEGGFALSGPSVPFLRIGEMLVGGIRDDINGPTTSFSLAAVGGGAFSPLSFDYPFFDLGDLAGNLSVTGLLNGTQVASQVFSLGASGNAAFGAGFANLTSVSFNGTSGFTLDHIGVQALAPVPEPATVVLTRGRPARLGAARTPASALGLIPEALP